MPLRCPRRDVECGYLIVPEDRARSGSPLIRLAVAILRSTSGNSLPDPILDLAGGPGVGAVAYAEQWLDSPLRRRRDVILFDQRGAGLSDPLLDCPELDELALDLLEQALTPEQEAEQRLEQARVCRDRLRTNGVNLAAYTSQASAADIADLRKTLGYAEWNLYGISYGSRLALTVLRDYPTGAQRDPGYPIPGGTSLLELVPQRPARVRGLFRGLPATRRAARLPDLRTTYYDLAMQLNQSPQVVPCAIPDRPDDQLPVDGRPADRDDVPGAHRAADHYLPFLVSEVRAGRPDLLAASA